MRASGDELNGINIRTIDHHGSLNSKVEVDMTEAESLPWGLVRPVWTYRNESLCPWWFPAYSF